jgi:hypothetical protein
VRATLPQGTMSRSPARLRQTPASDVSDSLGDERPRAIATAQAARDGYRAAASDADLRRGSRRWELRLAGVAVRAEVDLTVSGLKSDSPLRIRIAGGAPTGVRAQERAV